MKVPSWVKPAFWGAVVGAAGWWAVLSWQFGWVSGGTADEMAKEQAQKAVVADAAPACVARFKRQSDAVAQ